VFGTILNATDPNFQEASLVDLFFFSERSHSVFEDCSTE
jgi:hypothetical protein